MKQELIDLAIKHKFHSAFLYNVAYKYYTKEDLRYLFWMTELQQWLRETHNSIVIGLPYTTEDNIKVYIWMIYKIKSSPCHDKYFDTYEQALEEGLLEALKLIKL